MNEETAKSFGNLWSLDPEIAYLNHGSYGATPISVLAAQRKFQKELESCPAGLFNFEYWNRTQKCVEGLAEFLGAKPANLVFLENSTSGVSAVLRSAIQKTLKPGDKLLTTSHCYGAVRKAMDYVASVSGAQVIEAAVPFPLSLDARSAENQIITAIESSLGPKVRYLIIDHVASASGLIFPLKKILKLCKQRAIPVLVDGAHAPALIDLNLERLGELGASWYVGNCHKWVCAPKGSAFLWAHPDFQSELHPGTISHGYPKGFRDEFLWIGTRDPSAWFAVGAALDFIKERGLHFMQQHNNQLCDRAAELFAKGWGVERTVPRSLLGPMETLPIPGEWPAGELAAQCFMRYLYDRHKIIAQIYPFQDKLWLRISAQLYNSFSQYELLLDVLSLKKLNGVRSELDARIKSAH